ncbi:SubName: Full=Uncharacterized protein {ECO:0000313/EMBL:CCA75244.1} [Serendipita indica DSM 11827]|uniref:Uncharacterized protein n=1 Tax=Serendipita indica (strain DSM 11827) TaxID=1109443 RepID=G4TVA1_SERID|nr:SubName: Full=Uncharacterized protein {ECO:0000313/EMBL:CCA75244.1} [Serendipita indica DSM 11827]CCA75244.1 hypothetical protein PIIN_09228 [Serendipita indica DSM 11827]
MALALAVYSLSARAPQGSTSNATECLPSCAKQYRSLPGIVLSCLTTIFLCIWVSLHLNLPEPVETRGLGRFKRFKVWLRSFIRCTVIPIFVTLVFPEWVLGIAVLQFAKATQLAKDIGGTRQQGFFILMGGFHLFKHSQGPSRNQMDAQKEGGEENHPLVHISAAEEGDGRPELEEDIGEPVHPLDEFDVCRLIDAGKLRFPTLVELQDKCKSDGLAKLLVVVQTLWFIAQCTARKLSSLPLTELEVITLGYTLLTVSMYAAWWDKPYRVTFPIRVYATLPARTEEQEEMKRNMERYPFWDMAFGYVTGTQGDAVDLRSVRCVPMFYSGYSENGDKPRDFLSLTTTIVVGTVFGAVHFLAWSSPFPSNQMQFLWKFATIVMTLAPPAAVAVTALGVVITLVSENLANVIAQLLVFLLPPLYFVGRGITIILALVTLTSLPLEVYRDVEWTDFFPHI